MTDERTCLVTGASRGIGRAIATEFGSEGDTVVVNYCTSEGPAHDTVDAVEDAGGTGVAVQADVADREEVEAMRRTVHDAVGPVDVVVNNAGITRDALLSNMDDEDWQRVLDVSLTGTYYVTRELFDDVRNAQDGRVVNVSSVVGKQGNRGQANYAAAKSGLFGFTRSLALELAPSGSTANCVAPGFVRTGMLDRVDGRIQEKIRGDIPLDRFGTAEEVAALVGFLASERAGYMTGSIVHANGGIDL